MSAAEEEQRATDFIAQDARRREARVARERAMMGSASAARALRQRMAPVVFHIRPDQEFTD